MEEDMPLKEEDDLFDDLQYEEDDIPVKPSLGGKREHEIYKDTYYIPNDKIRLLEIPTNSNLTFQMLLYYHSYYDILYSAILIPTLLYKTMIGGKDALIIVGLILTVLYSLTEIPRLNFGYRGNINESFPELIAFTL